MNSFTLDNRATAARAAEIKPDDDV